MATNALHSPTCVAYVVYGVRIPAGHHRNSTPLKRFRYSYQAYRDASQNGLVRFHLPILGTVAEIWLSEE
jgi:hypothetical protein